MEWISVEKKLPESAMPVLIAAGYYIALANWLGEEKRFQLTTREDAALISTENITHWMPLPEPPKERHKEKSFDEILQPIRDDFAASGMTEDELDALVEKERQAIWEEKHVKNNK